MNNQYSPIILFVYNRPVHTNKTVDSLLQNELSKESRLIIYSDAAKNEQSIKSVNEVREYIKNIKGFKEIDIIEREKNFGLAENIINGVTEVIKIHNKVIVIEDDLLLSPYFLDYMNNALTIYENEEKVGSIHGYVYPVQGTLPETFFLRGADCWGWATWERAWQYFESDGSLLLKNLKELNLEKDFNFDNSYNYIKMLKKQIKGKNNSWAVRWHASLFIKNMLTLYPGISLVENIGADDSGTHVEKTDKFSVKISQKPINIKKNEIKESELARKLFINYFRVLSPYLIKNILSKISI